MRGSAIGSKIVSPPDVPEPIVLSEADRRRHQYLVGGTGCGKTSLILQFIESDVEAGRTLVVLDLRGDLIDRIVLRLAAKGVRPEDVCLLDLRLEERVVGLNPLGGSGDVHARAYQVLDVLRRQADSWGVQLDESLRNCLVALTEAGFTLTEVEPLLTDDRFRERTLRRVTDKTVLAFFDRYGSLSSERQAAWSTPCLNKVTPLLAIPRVRRVLGAGLSLDLRRHLDRPGSILLVALAADRLHSAAHLVGGLIVSALHNAVMARADVPESKRNRVNLYIDEFETMASDAFKAIIAEGRRFGLSLTISHQNLTQLPADLRQVVLNNVHTQFYFQTGSLDAARLAGELAVHGKKEDVQRTLMSQRVGEAFLARRGQLPVQMRTKNVEDPVVDRNDLAKFAQVALESCSRPAAEVEAEIEARQTPADSSGSHVVKVKHRQFPQAARRSKS